MNINYNRQKAVAYARRWALGRNPEFYDYNEIGGDCTNFVSQCVYAGIGIMNYNTDNGCELENLLPGDVIQLGDENNKFYHSLILTAIVRGFRGRRYYICAHSQDAYQRDLFSYRFESLRCIHIIGGRDE